MPRFLTLLSLALILAAYAPAGAAPPVLQWPVDCHLGEDCWIVHHVDTDPGPSAQDFRCGALTYNEHKGTDIALRDRKAIFRPVSVRAAAAGVVLGLRDTAPDHLGDEASIKASMDKGEECGNGVLLGHADGWTTQYCHLKSGSIAVGKGQRVPAGAFLGHVGQSGAAEFPHLHLAIRRDKETVDPFTGLAMSAGCKASPAGALWSGEVRAFLPEADAPMLFGAGFRASPPRFDALLQDMQTPAALPAEGPSLVLWGVAYGLRAGDILEFEVTDPSGGSFVAKRFTQEKTQIRRMQFTGRSNKNGILRPGVYTGLVRVIRERASGEPFVAERRVSVELVP